MNILTFDIEEWYLYQKFSKGGKQYFLPIIDGYLNQLLDLLDLNNQRATFFCLGKVAKEYPKVIEKIAENGHEIGCHSYEHKFVTEMNVKDFYFDTKMALKEIEAITGKKVKGYRAPAFSISEKNKWAFKVLMDIGIEYDCSVFPATRAFGGFPSFSNNTPSLIDIDGVLLKEFPINTAKIFGKTLAFSGGGYFRLIPYNRIQKLTKNADYIMSYFHIRDFDAKQKRVKSLRYFQSYYGINNAFLKLNKYINENTFLTVEQANNNIDWEKAPIVRI